MLQQDIIGLPLPDLMDLLVMNTIKLLELTHKKDTDKKILRDVRVELQLIQQVIGDKKSYKLKMAI
jgi:hypothetical protein